MVRADKILYMLYQWFGVSNDNSAKFLPPQVTILEIFRGKLPLHLVLMMASLLENGVTDADILQPYQLSMAEVAVRKEYLVCLAFSQQKATAGTQRQAGKRCVVVWAGHLLNNT